MLDYIIQSAALKAHQRLVGRWANENLQVEPQVGVQDGVPFDQGDTFQPETRFPRLIRFSAAPSLKKGLPEIEVRRHVRGITFLSQCAPLVNMR